MSETLLKILLDELQTLRIVCKQCQTVTEIAVARLDRQPQQLRSPKDMSCAGCGSTIRLGVVPDHGPQEDAFDLLVKAWQSLKAMKGHFDFQFVVPEKAPNKAAGNGAQAEPAK